MVVSKQARRKRRRGSSDFRDPLEEERKLRDDNRDSSSNEGFDLDGQRKTWSSTYDC